MIYLLRNVLIEYLRSIVTLDSLVGDRIWKDFVKNAGLKESGNSSIVLDIQGGDTIDGNRGVHYHTVGTYSYSDCTRDANKHAIKDDSMDRAWKIYHTLNNSMIWDIRKSFKNNAVIISRSKKRNEPINRLDKDLELAFVYATYEMEVIYDQYK